MNVSITYDDTLYQLVPKSFIREAEKLVHIAWSAHAKMRLAGRGSDCSLPHETRMFALEFSKESRDGPGALQVNGTGRAFKWLDEARSALSAAPTPPAQPSLSQQMRDKGFTRRDSGLACDECGEPLVSVLQAQVHKCNVPAQPAERKPLTDERIAAMARVNYWHNSTTTMTAYREGVRDAEAAHGITEP